MTWGGEVPTSYYLNNNNKLLKLNEITENLKSTDALDSSEEEQSI